MPEKSNSEIMSKYLYYLGDEIGKIFFMIVFSLLQNNGFSPIKITKEKAIYL